MTEPVYQAWQFLTLRAEAPDTAKGSKPAKGGKALDLTRDNLFTAIAKLGGLNRTEVTKAWGIDPKDKFESGVFGMPVLRKEGGKSLDGMLGALVEEGYILPDENGNGDPARLEELFDAQRRGADQYSTWHDYSGEQPATPVGEDKIAGKLNTGMLREQYGDSEKAIWRKLSARRMTSDTGIQPDALAERVGFDSGDALVKALVDATPPKEVIDARTDRRMLEEYGDINSPEALRRAADEAVHDEMRARVVAAEMKALEGGTKVNERRGTTSVDVLNEAAKSYAEELIGTMRLRDIRPAQYQAAAGRSGKLAETALKAGKTEEAMLHKRNQLVNIHAARAASDAKKAEEQGHAFLKRVQKPGRIPADNFDQITSLLERFDLRKAATAGELDSRARFSTWAKEQIERGEVPPNVELLLSKAGKAKYMAELQLRNEDGELVYADAEKELLLLAGLLESDSVRSYKELTSNEFNGLVDTVRQIDHTGRRIEGVLTAKDKRTFKAELERISSHVKTVAEQRGRVATDTESESTTTGKMKEVMRGAFFSQVKTHNMVHIIDGGPGGPLHERLVATAGDASNAEQIDVGAYHDKVRSA
ncbi:MAG: hypothetical protein IPO08_21880 [Xanthomonadales bacterium]|nr:hypothetical protein [Xanthomonadales bacterium]